MVETATQLADHVLPRLPVRQWVLSVAKRRRDHLHHDPTIETLALRIVLSVVEQALRRSCPAAAPDSRISAATFHESRAPEQTLLDEVPVKVRRRLLR